MRVSAAFRCGMALHLLDVFWPRNLLARAAAFRSHGLFLIRLAGSGKGVGEFRRADIGKGAPEFRRLFLT